MAETAVALSVGEAVALGRRRLEAAGCDTPLLDAQLLLGSALRVGRERLVLDRDVGVCAAACEQFLELLTRRERREPVAYILGFKEFRRLTLAVDRRVLIPRPETELLVEAGLELPAGWRVADVGTGSGAVALALKDERPDLVVRGLDLSADAIEVARANGAALGIDVEFACCDLLDSSGYDAVLANLPYVRANASLAPEISRFEPAPALLGGVDGLSVIRRMIAAAAGRVRVLALEIDPEQTRAVGALLRSSGFASVTIRHDLAGHDRVVVAAA